MDEDLLFLEETFYLNVCEIRPHDQENDNKDTISLVWWINVVCLPIIAVLGLTCNLLNLLVLTSNKSARRMPSWHLLVALALFDSLFLIFATLDVTPTNLHAFLNSPTLNSLYTHLVLYIRTLASTFFRVSILIVVSFNIERYVCVCKPLWAHRVCTSKTSKMTIFISFIIALGCSLQWPLVYKVVDCWDHKKLHSYSIIVMDDSPTLQTYFQITNYISLAVFNILPIALIFFLNIQLVRTLRRVVDQDRRRSSGADTQQMLPHVQLNDPNTTTKLNANTMLFAVVFLLLLCIGPQAFARIIFDYYGAYDQNVVVYMCISQLLVFLNASLNFCLYCLVSKRYRALLRDSIRRLFSTKQGGCWLSSSQLKTKFSALLHSPPVSEEEPMTAMEEKRRRASAPPTQSCTQL